jgi:hypothetical protein
MTQQIDVSQPARLGSNADQLLRELAAQRAVLGAQRAVMRQGQRLGQRDRVVRAPGLRHHAQDRVVRAGGEVVLGGHPDAQPERR